MSAPRIAALDGLRAVAVLAVIANHTGVPIARGGYLGVDVFFVLSGFLITDLLMRERKRTGDIRIGAFYARRALRLYPALIAAALIGALLVLGQVIDADRYGEHALIALLYLQDLANAFGLGPGLGPLNHTWSLAIEEHFYLLWPLVLLLAARFGRTAILATATSLVLVSFVLMQVEFQPTASPTAGVYYHPEARSAALLVGCALAVSGWRRLPPWLHASALPLLLVVIAVSPLANVRTAYLVSMPLVWLLTAALLVGAAGGSMASTLLSWRPAVYLGAISYGAYLYHPLVFDVLRDNQVASRSVEAVIGTALTIVIAALSYRFIESPFLNMKRRFASVELNPPT